MASLQLAAVVTTAVEAAVKVVAVGSNYYSAASEWE
jgi:hypothetical protein